MSDSAGVSQEILRNLPSVTDLLKHEKTVSLLETNPREMVVNSMRAILDDVRLKVQDGDYEDSDLHAESILGRVEHEVNRRMQVSHCRAINAAGVILHTGLGRAVMAEKAIEALKEHCGRYSLLATNRETGKRRDRDLHIEWLLQELTGAERGTVVNNNAGATMLILNTLAEGKEVICSRGQMVEIGGAFRIPDVMETSGAKLVEVGTTNRTHLRDYENGITENTGALLRVHNSNYKVIGFTSEVPIEDLVALGHKRHLPVIDDLGSGALFDFSTYGFDDEPLVRNSISAGVDVACFSADKLIGGAQGGIIVGRRDLIERIRKNPLARAMRVDKMCITVIEATLKLFLDEKKRFTEIPTLRMLNRKIDELEKEANRLRDQVKANGAYGDITVEDEFSQLGGGSLPGQTLPTKVVVVSNCGMGMEKLATRLRMNDPPVIARTQKDRMLFDLRTLEFDEVDKVAEALGKALTPPACGV
ncbi:MAG: L-seryl-tRNA(Sec) selenium transferase [Planctomycetota bacterium]|jgi:L-seryl-tRNA(Ser) seleniumtransferase